MSSLDHLKPGPTWEEHRALERRVRLLELLTVFGAIVASVNILGAAAMAIAKWGIR